MDLSELLKQAKKGDKQAFGEIYDLFADRIFRFIRLKINSTAEAEDLLQEIFIKAWRAMPEFKIEESAKFQGWIYKIAQNCINDRLRKMYRSPETLELDENIAVFQESHGNEDIDHEQMIAIVKSAFEFLPGQYKTIIELRFIQDLSIEETAKITGKTNLAIRLAQHRAIKQLRKILNKRTGERAAT